jgi:hypothetical protein
MQHARSTLSKIYATATQHVAGDQAPVIAWPLVCGSKVAGRTSAVACTNGQLAVRVPDKLWRSQLECLADRYIAALNQVSRNKVSSIRFIAPD